jgi:hypothetical protein
MSVSHQESHADVATANEEQSASSHELAKEYAECRLDEAFHLEKMKVSKAMYNFISFRLDKKKHKYTTALEEILDNWVQQNERDDEKWDEDGSVSWPSGS